MFSVYHNPQAKYLARKYAITSLLILILSIAVVFAIDQYYHSLTIQQATQLQAVVNTNGSTFDYFNGMPLSPQALTEANRLSQLQFVPKQWTSHFFVTASYVVAIWLVIAALLFLFLTHSLNQIFNRIQRIQQFTTYFFNEDKPLDIRTNEQGVISSLENDIYHIATELHTRLYTNKKQKDYLAKNLADISHQLKTPLTALLVVNDTLLSLPIDERTDDKLLLLEPQLLKIEQFIQKMLILTRLDASALLLKKDNYNLNDLITTITSEFSILLAQKNITCTVNIAPHITIFADKFYITEAISNVIKNAIEHTYMNGELTITVEDTIFSTTLSIFNTGDTISSADLPYIFQRFYRGKNAAPTSVGIGLSLAYEIVDLHQGKLTAENTQNGVLFMLAIPK